MRRLTSVFLAVGFATAAICGSLPAAAVVTPVGVKTTSLDEFAPSAGMDPVSGDTYFAWTQNSASKPQHHDAYLDVTSGPTTTRTKLNAPGSLGWDAGIDGTNLVFQEVPRDTGNSDLVLYDISSHTRLPTPSGLDSRAWQWGPTISGEWILYGENSRKQNFSRVMLHNTNTGEERILAESSYKKFNVWQGQVSGDYAVYATTARIWHVVVYQISTGHRTEVPSRHDMPVYTPAVTADGTVYYARSGRGCGVKVRIYRWSVTSPSKPVPIAALPDGKDISDRLYAFNDGSSTTLYFDRFSCGHSNSGNIYRIDGADTAT